MAASAIYSFLWHRSDVWTNRFGFTGLCRYPRLFANFDSIALTFRLTDEGWLRWLRSWKNTRILLRPLFQNSLNHRSAASMKLMNRFVCTAVPQFSAIWKFLITSPSVLANRCESMKILRHRRVLHSFLWHWTDISRNGSGIHPMFRLI